MEEELEREFYNDTMLEDYEYDYSPSVSRMIHHILSLLFAFIGLISNSLIIYTVAKTKSLHTKTYIILANFCINDSIFLLTFPIGLSLLRYVYCFENGAFYVIIACIIIMFILLINPIINKESITTKRILQTLYIPLLIVSFTNALLCYLDYEFRYNQIVLFVTYGILFLTVIFFEIVTICRRNQQVVDEDYIFRFNICRIYTYNVFILLVTLLSGPILFYIVHWLPDFVILSYLLNSSYMLVYAIFKNKKFSMAFLSILRRDSYKIDEGLNSPNNNEEVA